MDIYSTYYMLAAIKKIPLEHTFFKERYFPTDAAKDIFGTSKVLVDYMEDTQGVAPFVLPRVGAVPIGRDGYKTAELEPPNISISIPLTIDHLKNRGFGESLLSEKTPAEREQYFLIEDLAKLSARISRTEEILAVQTMLDNGCVMRHRTDREDVYEDIEVRFYEGTNNPALYTPAAPWTHSKYENGVWTKGSWHRDICNMIKMLTQNGNPAEEILVSADVSDFLMADAWVLATLDNRRMEMGEIDPKRLTEYVHEIGVLNFEGRRLPIIVNDGTYKVKGNVIPYIPNGTVIVTAPNVGKGLYGAVTQMELDGHFHTYAARRVPMHYFSQRPPVKETQLTSRPLLVPKVENPWTVAKNVLGLGS